MALVLRQIVADIQANVGISEFESFKSNLSISVRGNIKVNNLERYLKASLVNCYQVATLLELSVFHGGAENSRLTDHDC